MCDGPMIKLLSDRIELGMKKFDYENHSYLFLALSCGFFVSKNKSSHDKANLVHRGLYLLVTEDGRYEFAWHQINKQLRRK